MVVRFKSIDQQAAEPYIACVPGWGNIAYTRHEVVNGTVNFYDQGGRPILTLVSGQSWVAILRDLAEILSDDEYRQEQIESAQDSIMLQQRLQNFKDANGPGY